MAIFDQVPGLKVEIVDSRYHPLAEYINDKSDLIVDGEKDPRRHELQHTLRPSPDPRLESGLHLTTDSKPSTIFVWTSISTVKN